MAGVMRRTSSLPRRPGPTRQERQNIDWARESLAAMQPFSKGGSYLNFPGFGEEKETMLRASYGPNYDRLVALKTQYDPDNLFRMNLNIAPERDVH